MNPILPLIAFLFLPAILFAQDNGWYNGKSSPYTISTADELSGLQSLVADNIESFNGKTILLANDIALAGNWTPIGNDIQPFQGTFNGQGKTISGLSVNGGNYAGLFGYVGTNGQIKNLNVVATDIKTATGGTTARYAGSLAAYYASAKPIENCNVQVATIMAAGYGGGLVGYASSALAITNSYASGNTTGSGGGSGSGNSGYYGGNGYSGGLVGYAAAKLDITNSYASGNVNGTGSGSNDHGGGSGGLVGNAKGASTIATSYASGNISGSNKGGIFGSYASGTNTYVYYNNEGASAAAGSGSPSGILAMSSTTLKKQGTYINWDFNSVWDIDEGVSYPYLNLRASSSSSSTTTIPSSSSVATTPSSSSNNLSSSSVTAMPSISSSSSFIGNSSSSKDNSQIYEYCVFTQDKFCVSGSYETCPTGGTLSHNCPFDEVPVRVSQLTTANIRAQATSNAILLSNLPPNAKIELYNLQGKCIYFVNSENSKILRIPVQTKGVYIVKVGTKIIRAVVR